MQWEKVITDPLGIAGFALSLAFALATRVISQKRKGQNRWLAPAAYALAVICVVGGFSLAWHRDSAKPVPVPVPPAAIAPQPATRPSSITIGDINQSGDGNVAGVQGDVRINSQQKKSRAHK
ncbi:hypothetical protein RBB77_13155 [Tunturibacter psychrotolerans]|uniref:Uncharacterized protein n=1 Tax=Tunturiibacter psychrotolerans TaxID=3069686 RepID=A0AAU7ZJN2_9BACT